MKKALQLLFASLFTFHVALAQEVAVKGRVSSAEDGSPLVGASIRIEGTGTGTSSGANGQYVMRASQGQVLLFSFVGRLSTTRTVGDGSVINVVLESDGQSLDEVVVTALGIERSRKNLTYSVQ